MKIAIVTGMIASYPVGGVAWDYGHYALGLERLGYNVYYLEDTGWETYNPEKGEYGTDCTYGVDFLAKTLSSFSFSLGQRWHFRNMDGTTYGISPDTLRDVLASADFFLNVSGGTLLRDDYMACRNKILIDTDPGWNHFRNYPRWDAQPNWHGSHGYRAHDHFFTYAERIGKPDCPLPDMGITWCPTRPPVVMDCWHAQPPATHWTTVLTWKNFQEPITYNGITYGTKEMEFGRVQEIPHRVKANFELAIGGAKAPVETWKKLGWNIQSAQAVSQTGQEYKDYIERSRGEFSVAKNVYVATRSGWFSCRSVCYLAAGRPVVVQDTGFSEFLPVGNGLLTFTNIDDAAASIREVENNYSHHQEAAIEIARNYFDAHRVLGDMMQKIGIT
jgi:hypothetical protein